MRNLLDTHTFIWYIEGDAQLSKNAKNAIETEGALNYISIASIWEIATKVSLGKLELKAPFSKIAEQIEFNGFEFLSVSFADILTLLDLPYYHRDPFDRMIIVQSMLRDLTILSKDGAFDGYEINLIW